MIQEKTWKIEDVQMTCSKACGLFIICSNIICSNKPTNQSLMCRGQVERALLLPDALMDTIEDELAIGVLRAVENLAHILGNGLTNRAKR